MPRKKIERYKKSVIPVVFKRFLRLMKEFSEVKNKKSVTTFRDECGPFASVPLRSSNGEKMTVVLNKSRGWERSKTYKRLEIGTYVTGDIQAVATTDPKSIKQAVKLCMEWKAAKPDHKTEISVKGEPKKKHRAPRREKVVVETAVEVKPKKEDKPKKKKTKAKADEPKEKKPKTKLRRRKKDKTIEESTPANA